MEKTVFDICDSLCKYTIKCGDDSMRHMWQYATYVTVCENIQLNVETTVCDICDSMWKYTIKCGDDSMRHMWQYVKIYN